MKRVLTLAAILVLAATALPAAADPGHAAPKITVAKFLQPPLKAGINEVLKVVAHDPDSWISEIQVQFEDASGSGGVTFAHTYCIQDPDYKNPGIPSKLRIPIMFQEPGAYHLDVQAISSNKCAGGPSTKTSKTVGMDVIVTEALENATDPDDTGGPFDIEAMEQTQESSETSATTEIVHRFRMFEGWSEEDLAGPARMEMWFNLDKDPDAFERVLTIDLDERDGEVRASMLDQATGQARGYAAVFRPDDRTIELRFPPTLLKEGIHDYQWFFTTDGGESEGCTFESPCLDRALDESMMRHRL